MILLLGRKPTVCGIGQSYLICCDTCGIVAVEEIARRDECWRKWTDHMGGLDGDIEHHHCKRHVELNELIAAGLLRGVDQSSAQVYDEEWD